MATYQCQHCDYKFTAHNPTQCPNCYRTSAALSTYRTKDDTDFWLTTFTLLAATDDSPAYSPSSSCSNSHSSSDSYSSSYSDSSSYDSSSSSD